MKKLLVFIILSLGLTAGQHESSTGAITPEEYMLEISMGLLLSPLFIIPGSIEMSADSSKTLNNYAQFEKLTDQENVKAKDIFTIEQREYLALKDEDEIIFDKTTMGILVSSSSRPLFVVPSDTQYTGVSKRSER